MCPLLGKALQISEGISMYSISKAPMKPPAIPLIHQKTVDKRLVVIAAGIAILFSLNAMAADTSPANTSPAAVPGARSQQDIRQEMRDHWEKMSPGEREQVRTKMKEHWNNMSPEEREARRKEMREHFNNMSPEEREQFKRDMGKRGVRPRSLDDLPSDNTASPAN
jgi:hypothetical protein